MAHTPIERRASPARLMSTRSSWKVARISGSVSSSGLVLGSSSVSSAGSGSMTSRNSVSPTASSMTSQLRRMRLAVAVAVDLERGVDQELGLLAVLGEAHVDEQRELVVGQRLELRDREALELVARRLAEAHDDRAGRVVRLLGRRRAAAVARCHRCRRCVGGVVGCASSRRLGSAALAFLTGAGLNGSLRTPSTRRRRSRSSAVTLATTGSAIASSASLVTASGASGSGRLWLAGEQQRDGRRAPRAAAGRPATAGGARAGARWW